jgi:hypothetical protein
MAAGPTKWVKLVDFLKNTYPQIMNGMVQRKEEKVCDVWCVANSLSLI